MRSVSAGTEPAAQSAGAVSIPRRATRLRLRFAGHQHESVGNRPRRNPAPDTGELGIDAGGVLGGDPRRMARGRGARRCHRNTRARRTRVVRGVGDRRVAGQRPRRRRAALVDRPAVAGTRPAPARPRRPVAPMRADRSPRCRHPWLSGHATAVARRRRHRLLPGFHRGESRRARLRRRDGSRRRAQPRRRRGHARRQDPDQARSAGMGQAVRRRRGGPAATLSRRHRRGAAAVPELPAVRLVVRGDRRVRAAGLGADPGNHHARRRIRVRLPLRGGVQHPAAAVDRRAWSGCCRGWRSRSCRRCFPALFGVARCRGAQADRHGRSGSPVSGRWPSGPSRRCRSADSPGA